MLSKRKPKNRETERIRKRSRLKESMTRNQTENTERGRVVSQPILGFQLKTISGDFVKTLK